MDFGTNHSQLHGMGFVDDLLGPSNMEECEPLPADFDVDDLFTADLVQFLAAPSAPISGMIEELRPEPASSQDRSIAATSTAGSSPISSAPASPQHQSSAADMHLAAFAPALRLVTTCVHNHASPPVSSTSQDFPAPYYHGQFNFAAAAEALVSACPQLQQTRQQVPSNSSEDSEDTCDGEDDMDAEGNPLGKEQVLCFLQKQVC